MKKIFLAALGSCFLFSCERIETYTCTCHYEPIAGVKGIAAKTETHSVKGRGFERASSNCQTDYMLKYVKNYYKRGECTLK